jgi:hypothetical protein
MRTKALFLTVALGAAGIATSMAQVYSVNAVGYVNVTIPGGNKFALISNPLIAATNTLDTLFPPTVAPLGSIIYTIVGGGFQVTQNDAFGLGWLDEMGNPAGSTRSVVNGEGFFFYNPDPNAYTITFVGEVPQGNPVVNPIPINFSMRGSKVPQTGLIQTDLGFPASPGDLLQKFNVGTQAYEVYSVDPFAADPALPTDWFGPLGNQLEPTMAIAEGAIVYKPGGAKNWNRNFTVN